jgi:hypothetical protein
MGYIPSRLKLPPVKKLKELLQPYHDDDYIRNNIYAFAEANPEKRFDLDRDIDPTGFDTK